MHEQFSEEQLNSFDKNDLVKLLIEQQKMAADLDNKLQNLLEQMAAANKKCFGRSSEKMVPEGQARLIDINGDGELTYFNEAEAICDAIDTSETSEETITYTRSKKVKGKRDDDIKGLPVEIINHEMTAEELADRFSGKGYKQLPDEIYRRYKYVPAYVGIEEHHVAVYSEKNGDQIVKAKHPAYLLRNSLVSPSIEAAIINAKYTNAVPLYRIEKDFERKGLNISRKNMASWTIACSERYLSIIYDYLKTKLINDYHTIQADETPTLVNKDGRDAGVKSYMWVYRTGETYKDNAIILYEYQKTRNASHPREFLKDFSGVCLTDGYQVYHTIEKEREDLVIAGCWAHARRRYDEAVKALPEISRKSCLAYKGLQMIQDIYKADNKLKNLSAEERLLGRQSSVAPLVEAYFAWIRSNISSVRKGSKTHEGMNYSLNQEKYLKTFLNDGEVPIDNNAAERSIRGFCVGKKNWIMHDTVSGAKSSAIIYSLVETAKANNLNIYEYIKYLLEVIPEHMDDTNTSFCEELLPWSSALPDKCKKKIN